MTEICAKCGKKLNITLNDAKQSFCWEDGEYWCFDCLIPKEEELGKKENKSIYVKNSSV